MGRNRKMGLDYFPFDIDTFQDIRIRKLIKYQGGKAMSYLQGWVLHDVGRRVALHYFGTDRV